MGCRFCQGGKCTKECKDDGKGKKEKGKKGKGKKGKKKDKKKGKK